MRGHLSQRVIWPLLAALSLGCSDDSVLVAPSTRVEVNGVLSSHVIGSSEQTEDRLGIEGKFLRIERAVPGFAGFYLDTATQEIVMRVRTGADRRRATAEIKALVSGLPVEDNLRNRVLATDELRSEVADYAFSDLVRFHQRLRPVIFAIPGVVGLDVNERHNRVEVTVKAGTAQSSVYDGVESAGVPIQRFRW